MPRLSGSGNQNRNLSNAGQEKNPLFIYPVYKKRIDFVNVSIVRKRTPTQAKLASLSVKPRQKGKEQDRMLYDENLQIEDL